MKRIIFFIATALPSMLYAQGKYNIKGKVGNLNAPAKAYLSYTIDNKSVTDSALLKAGTFEFSGQITDMVLATLAIDHNGTGAKSLTGLNADITTVFIQAGATTIVSTDSVKNAKITGTTANEDYARYKLITKPVMDASKVLKMEYQAASAQKKASQEFNAYLQTKINSLNKQIEELTDTFISQNPDAYIGLQSLSERFNAELYPDAGYYQALFSKFSQNVRLTKAATELKKRIDKLLSVGVGSIAPDFVQPDTSGNPIKLSSFRGKYVLVDFWASWCGPCRSESPNMVKIYNVFKGKNFTIVGVSLDQPDKKDNWLKAIHDDGLKWTQVSNMKSGATDAAVLYSVQALPQNVLIDPDGKIVARNIFGEELSEKLTEIFGTM